MTWPIHTCDMYHSWFTRFHKSCHMRQHSFKRMTWPIHTCDMYHMTWPIHTCDMYHMTWPIHTCDMYHMTWPIHTCDMYHSWSCHMWQDLCTRVKSLIHTWRISHSYVWQNSFICVTWLIHMYDMTHSYVWHYTLLTLCSNLLIQHDTFIYVTHMNSTWLIHMCDMTHYLHFAAIFLFNIAHSYMWNIWIPHHSFTCVTWHITYTLQQFSYSTSHIHIYETYEFHMTHS